MFNGSLAALITPFQDGAIDEKALVRLVHHHLDNGTHALVPVGTTGEAPALNKVEHHRVVEIVVQECGGQVPVIAGAGSYNIDDAIELTRIVSNAGADAALHVTGYYNRPSQEGIFQHFETLDETTAIPLLVYNIPSRAVVDIEPNTMARLARLDNVIGVKDSTRDLARPLLEQSLIDEDFCFLTGEDMTSVAYNANGGQGCISVTANIAPKLCSEVQEACAAENFELARQIQLRLMPLHQALFLEPSPAGAKYASSLLRLNTSECRLPMVALSSRTKEAIKSAMSKLDLI